jgi:hypothetical protein
MPLFRALVVDGATYYLIFIIAFGLQIVANTSNEVGRFRFIESNRPWHPVVHKADDTWRSTSLPAGSSTDDPRICTR